MVPLWAQLDSMQWFLQLVFGILLTLTGLFLVLLVLVQRGRGGGLSGAFGGMGGQSAFGTKAGDVFTRITIGAAIFWILLCLAAVMFLPQRDKMGPSELPTATSTDKPGTKPGDKPGAGGTKPADKPGDKKPASKDK